MEATIANCGPAGIIVRGGDTAKPQIVATTGKRWSDKAERAFLEMLAATCNVRRAAQAAGFGTITVYQRRLRYPGFAEQWADALDTGYARLELAVLEAANDTLAGVAFDPDRPIPRMTMNEALQVLQLHRATVKFGQKNGSGWRLRPADPEKARAAILKKVAAVRRARKTADPA